jgi:hypothetical protein
MQEQDGCASSIGGGSGGDVFVKEEGVPSLLSYKGAEGAWFPKRHP